MPEPILVNKDLDTLISSDEYIQESTAITESSAIVPTRSKKVVDDSFTTFSENNIPVARAESKVSNELEQAEITRFTPLDDAAVGSFGDQTLELIIGNDDRKKVPNVLDNPWKKIAGLIITSQSGTQYAGTGWFISPRVLITAGHCVFLHDVGGFAKQIEVIPAWNGAQRPYGTHVSKLFKSSNGWVNDRNSDYDYGIIILDEKAHQDIGWFAFAAPNDEYINEKIVNVSGYPRDPDKYSYQYYHAKEIDRSSKHKVYYTADTTGGDSGACLWLTLGECERVVVGLHTTGSSVTNYGTRITPQMFNNFKKVKDEYQ